MSRPLKLGAVMYDPKVSVIWEIIRDFFESLKCPLDVTFYASYELQVDALMHREIDIAWNSPLAWLDAQHRSGATCRAIAMRDTDRDRMSYLVARIGGPVNALGDLRGRTIAVGAVDSPQATLIPLGLLRQSGIEPARNVDVRRFDVVVGMHGDHVGGELEAFQCLARDEAACSAMLDLNWQTWTKDGTIDPNRFKIIATTAKFDHCVFTVHKDVDRDAEARWLNALFSMRYDEPAHREMMDLEGLKAWLPGRTSGFQALTEAVEAEGLFKSEDFRS